MWMPAISRTVAASCAGLLLAAAAEPSAQGEPTVRTVHVSVVDASGAPVTDLGPADFEVKEDGKVRDVFGAEIDGRPIDIALLVDDNGTGINDLRRGLAGFMQRLYLNANIALVTTAGQNVTVVDYTGDPRLLQAGISSLVGRAAPRGGHLIDGIYEAATRLRQREGARRAIVVITFEGEEFSGTSDNRALDQLRASGAVLHVITIGRPVLRAMNPLTDGPQGNPVDSNFNRSRVLSDGSKRSGGRYEEMAVTTGVPAVLASLARELAVQYIIRYLLPPGVEPSEEIEVHVSRPRLTIYSPTRVPITQP